METTTFKVGDRVYLPSFTHIVCDLEHNKSIHCNIQPLEILLREENCILAIKLTKDGKMSDNTNQIIFHATEKNHKLLSELHPNIDFEKPKSKLKGTELAKKLAKDSYILAWTDCHSDEKARNHKIARVVKYNNITNHFETELGHKWEYAVPAKLTKNGTVEITKQIT
ncbi:hypothetical protein QJU93_09885 [Pasteurella skyensis]|uniref:Uncharacterized protein n=1 Tax=Phocoenobacter skyensis TaxID=97481 RepID=A0AAJ6NBA4_9PAST|nr:hypothetical protein [Pasteurella skyensis]MDP8173664.1 hypothetical protein [Pasteurella skyensis]MDP8178032.1 hypothetical protein [Pasteurella skyensis]